MPIVTLEGVKSHIKVENDAEDALIQTYIDAGEGFVRRYCGQDFEDNVPPVIKVACLTVIAGMYESRQHVLMTEGRAAQFKVNRLVYDYLEQHRVNRGVA